MTEKKQKQMTAPTGKSVSDIDAGNHFQLLN